MKIVFSSDWHLRSDWYPQRADNGREVQENILDWLASIGDTHIIAGDILHRWSASSSFINWAMGRVSRLGDVYVIYGNHDLQANTMKTVETSALHTLELAGVVKAPRKPVKIGNNIFVFEHYGETAYEPENDGERIILILHWAVFEEEIPFWSEEGLTAEEVLEQYPWADMIVCGDIHTPFIYRDGRRTLINCGGLFRERPNDTEKYVYIFDTDSGEIEQVEVPDSPEWVAVEVVNKESEISELVSAIKDFEVGAFDFRKALYTELRERNRKDLIELVEKIEGEL